MDLAGEIRAICGDDVNRIERPGVTRDWSRTSIDNQRKVLAKFEARWKKVDPAQWPIANQVDYKLIGSALARVRWEFDIDPRWKRDPNFYIAQTLTLIVEALTRARRIHTGTGCEISTRKSPDGRTDRASGSDRVF